MLEEKALIDIKFLHLITTRKTNQESVEQRWDVIYAYAATESVHLRRIFPSCLKIFLVVRMQNRFKFALLSWATKKTMTISCRENKHSCNQVLFFVCFFFKVNIKNKFALTATLARAERENMQERASVPCTLVHFLFSWSCASHEQLIRGVVYQKKKKKTVSRSLFWLKSFLKCFGPPSREATPRKQC